MKRISLALLLIVSVSCAGAPSATSTLVPARQPLWTLPPATETLPPPTPTLTPSPTLLPPYPVVFSIDPASGPIAGGIELTITGDNLADAIIQLDKEVLTPIAQSDTEIRLVTPKHDNGIALIRIQSALGTGYGEFLYLPPSLDEIDAGDITTVAGIGDFFGEGRLATQAMVEPTDIALDANGNIYLTEPQLNRILRIRADGVIEIFAGGGFGKSSADGILARDTQLAQARGIALDKDGNLIYGDAFTNRVRRINTQTGVVTTIAGSGTQGFSGDGGPAVNAQLNLPSFLVADEEGNIFFIDSGNMRIRRIAPDGIITTIAGNGTPGYSGDGGPATEAQFNLSFLDVGGLALDPDGSVYLADSDNFAIRKIDMRTGIISTIYAQTEGEGGEQLRALAFDQSGNLYFATNDYTGPQIVQMRDGEIVRTFGQSKGFSKDGTPASEALFGNIDKMQIDAQGNILLTDTSAKLVRRINISTGLLETVAGIGPAVIGENGPALGASPHLHHTDLAFLANGDLLIADANAARVWRLSSEGVISSYIGTGYGGDSGLALDLPFEEISISGPIAIEVAEDGTIYFMDVQFVLRIGKDSILRKVFAPPGCCWGFSGDGGPASEAYFMQPWDFALDNQGNILIADTNNNRIRRVDAITGIVTTVAGSGPSNGFEGYGNGTFCGDNGPAIEACLNSPQGIAVDAEGNMYIADSQNSRIRKVDQNGIITTFVDFRPYGGFPTKMVFDIQGNMYTGCGSRIFRISPTGHITVLAGGDDGGFSGDGGPAIYAQLELQGQADGIAIDSQGNLYFVDAHSRRVRVIKLAAAPAAP